MDELSKALKVANTAFKTVRVIDVVKKTVVTASVLSCGLLIFRLWRK